MNRRKSESCDLKRRLGFNLYDVINTKEQTIITTVITVFEGQSMETQFSA